MNAPRLFSTFILRKQLFGLDISEVQEVLREQATTPVPLAPAAVVGLMNLRGQIVTVIDLRRQLSLGGDPLGGAGMNMVVRSPEGPVCLVIDEVGDVVEADEKAFEPLPDTVEPFVRDIIKGVYKLETRLLHVLDVKKAIELDGRSKTA